MPHLVDKVVSRHSHRLICLLTGEFWTLRNKQDGELFTYCKSCRVLVPYQDVAQDTP